MSTIQISIGITPSKRFILLQNENGCHFPESTGKELLKSFQIGQFECLCTIANIQLPANESQAFLYIRSICKDFFSRLVREQEPADNNLSSIYESIRPDDAYYEWLYISAPPILGSEYLDTETLRNLWSVLESGCQVGFKQQHKNLKEYIKEINPAWLQIGRVIFHLAENKQDSTGNHPFAFMVTYVHRLTETDKPKHLPLSAALTAYATDKKALLALLKPIHAASLKSELIKQLVETNEIYRPLAWSPEKAYLFLKDIAPIEESGVLVKLPNIWKSNKPSKAKVSVKINAKKGSKLGLDALLELSVETTVNGEVLTPKELAELLKSQGGLVRIKDTWVEADTEKINELLKHWQLIKESTASGISFIDGMRLLAGTKFSDQEKDVALSINREAHVEAVGNLKKLLEEISHPESIPLPQMPISLQKVLRPYQLDGVKWLWRMSELGFGCCLADDMGLGKSLQILTFLTLLKESNTLKNMPALLIAPASLMKNWESEVAKFAPHIKIKIFHPMAMPEISSIKEDKDKLKYIQNCDVLITTLGMLNRQQVLQENLWPAIIVDEAQAIKNPESKQSKAVRGLKGRCRITLTGTPIENSLSDLWSIFDFICPNLLGTIKHFKKFIENGKTETGTINYAPLRQLTKPYILRRLKTDKRIINDLPDKTEVKTFCFLTKEQVVLYTKAVQMMKKELETSDKKKRPSLIFKYLMIFKQICNHPAQYTGNGDFNFTEAGKLFRLKEITEEISARQEKVLVFSQFKEMTEPLHDFLATIFGRPGLILHGDIAIKKRQGLVEQFQSELGPPFFVLSVKAAGTGLNLTAANHVVHFDRWWNPAVENQATDRAFRIGQHRNVLVHKFICKGTIEEKIDQIIDDKKELADSLLSEGAEKLLTSMDNEELLKFVSLDLTANTTL